MKARIREVLTCGYEEIEYRLRCLCGQPSPMKRFIIVLIIGGALSAAFIHTTVDAVYNTGINEARKEFLQLEHIRELKLKNAADSIFLIDKDKQ